MYSENASVCIKHFDIGESQCGMCGYLVPRSVWDGSRLLGRCGKGYFLSTSLGRVRTLHDMEAITKQINLPARIPLTAAPADRRTVAIAMLAFEDTLY